MSELTSSTHYCKRLCGSCIVDFFFTGISGVVRAQGARRARVRALAIYGPEGPRGPEGPQLKFSVICGPKGLKLSLDL